MAHAARRVVALVSLWLAGALLLLGGTSEGAPLRLDRSPDKLVALELAASSRPEPESKIPIHSRWRLAGTAGGVRTWETRNPIRPRTLFFHRAPKGMRLHRIQEKGTARKLKIASDIEDATREDTWSFSTHGIKVRRSLSEGPPSPGEYVLRYPRAVERERSLNRSMADVPDDRSFTFRSVQIADTSRHGLLLPAPSAITFQVEVPAGAELRLDARIIPPEAAMGAVSSDGAQLTVLAGEQEVGRLSVDASERSHQLDLSAWGGQTVALTLQTSPGQDGMLDYVFLAEPTILVPQEAPPRVIIVFIDTLRPDHMSLYGYDRPTSPRLDAWAEDAAVFTQARSIAPWTLPSARTMLTGAHPERWDKVPHLQDRFADAGWATAFIAGNVYLSSNFKMAEGWGTHRCINWPQASVQVDRALRYLSAHDDEPVFMMLHLMDMHLPYTEPLTHRYRFAGETPPSIGKDYFLRSSVTRGAKSEEQRQYVRDRYDNNLRYIDDHLARVFDALSPEDTVVILSDHGEEFWDHGGFEHGHSLYDELLRVPMVIKSPGVGAGRFDEPVSLLDLAPTLAGLSGLGTDGMVGWDLTELSHSTQSADFSTRPHAFGRPLYGLRKWGSLQSGKKYVVSQGKETVYDILKDPTETDNLISTTDTAPLRAAMSEALDRPVVQGWRILPSRKREGPPVRVTLHSTGIRAAWPGVDPTQSGRATVALETDKVVIRWPKQRGRVEAFVVPGPPRSDAPPISVDIKVGKKRTTATLDLQAEGKPGKPARLLKESIGGRSIEITSTVMPIPSEADGSIDGFDSEVAGDLESLGYIGD
jgi:arylsulfatase A-like enzyme